MQKKFSVKALIPLLLLLYCAFTVLYWQRILGQTRQAVREHSRIISESLWNLDPKGSLEYLNAAVSQHGYDHLVVTEPNGRTFIEISPAEPDGLDRLLIRARLIPLIPVSTDVTYHGDRIGTLSVVWRCKAIYPYTYVLLVTGLILMVILLYDRVLNEKHNLTSKVEERTNELRKAMEDLRASEANFRLLADTAPVAISIYSGRKFLYVNSSWEELTGYSRKEAMELDPMSLVHPDMRDAAVKNAENRLTGKPAPNRYELKVLSRKGETIWCDFSATVLNYNNEPAAMYVTPNITEQKKVEEEREVLIEKLRKALDEIKTLRGIIPVCSHCKNIRDDAGIWNRMEKYILEHSDAQFSHSICPECAKKLYPGLKIYDEATDLQPSAPHTAPQNAAGNGNRMEIEVSTPGADELERKGIYGWPIWEKEVSRFDWHYDTDETCYLLEGRVEVTTPDGRKVRFGAGDLVRFPAGLSCTWDISVPVKKHYRFG